VLACVVLAGVTEAGPADPDEAGLGEPADAEPADAEAAGALDAPEAADDDPDEPLQPTASNDTHVSTAPVIKDLILPRPTQ
jgi:hypothetical protein